MFWCKSRAALGLHDKDNSKQQMAFDRCKTTEATTGLLGEVKSFSELEFLRLPLFQASLELVN